jgi:hypothetical protein
MVKIQKIVHTYLNNIKHNQRLNRMNSIQQDFAHWGGLYQTVAAFIFARQIRQ